jgi:CubicO group peptidase (beta-lactamase class C family)
MTKPITGVTLMTFYEEGLFELDDPLADYLPEYADVEVWVSGDGDDVVLEAPDRPLTVADILRHTAGFGGGTYVSARLDELQIMSPDNLLAEMSEKLASVPLGYQPGTQWQYGPSVDVQARLVEVLAGKPFAEVMRARVLDPLAMNDTRYVLLPAQRDRLMALFERQADGTFRQTTDATRADFNSEPHALTPGGWGLVSTLDDYMRFARMLVNDGELDGVRILDAETVQLMATDLLPDTVTDRSWLPKKGQMGFGIDFAVRVAPPIHTAEPSGAVGEFFWDGAANTLFWVDPKNDIAAVLFNQYLPWGKLEIMKDFRDAVYYRDAEASALGKPPAPPDAPRLSD